MEPETPQKPEILKTWQQKKMQIYELIKNIQADEELRKKWIARRARAILLKNPHLDQDNVLETVTEFFETMEILNKVTETGKPTVRISPRKVKGIHYTEILGIKSENFAGCITRLVDSAADDIVKGYRKGVLLGTVFGPAFSERFNSYVKQKVEREVLKDGRS